MGFQQPWFSSVTVGGVTRREATAQRTAQAAAAHWWSVVDQWYCPLFRGKGLTYLAVSHSNQRVPTIGGTVARH